MNTISMILGASTVIVQPMGTSAYPPYQPGATNFGASQY